MPTCDLRKIFLLVFFFLMRDPWCERNNGLESAPCNDLIAPVCFGRVPMLGPKHGQAKECQDWARLASEMGLAFAHPRGRRPKLKKSLNPPSARVIRRHCPSRSDAWMRNSKDRD